jgi:uncharacterized membrane protein
MEQEIPAIKIDEQQIHLLFRWSVFLKGIHAIIEIVGGTLFLILAHVPNSLPDLIASFSQEALISDKDDIVSRFLFDVAHQLSVSSELFAGYYLLSHGLVKIILVIALLKNKLWAYPWSLGVLGVFILYQLYRFTFTHALGLILLTIFDLFVMWLIWKEYRIVRKH